MQEEENGWLLLLGLSDTTASNYDALSPQWGVEEFANKSSSWKTAVPFLEPFWGFWEQN